MTDYSSRRSAVLSLLADEADALLVTARTNVRYLSGFTGTNGWLLFSAGEAVFLTDPRYEQQAHAEVSNARIGIERRGLEGGLADALQASAARRVAFESHDVSVAAQAKLVAATGADWVGRERVVERVRRSKDDGEIDAIRRALMLTQDALAEVAGGLSAGRTEIEVAAELEYACRRRGAEGMAFETIVASGPRSALPHGVASARVIRADEPVMIDMGCRLDGYCSDITRMVWCGAHPAPAWLRMHELVDRARATALAALAAELKASEVDAAARDVIESAGHGDSFRHGTGHGVGLEIHEGPTVSSRSGDWLERGMVVTVEPAVYFDGEFGIRIEDMAVVSGAGPVRLTTLGTEPILPKAP